MSNNNWKHLKSILHPLHSPTLYHLCYLTTDDTAPCYLTSAKTTKRTQNTKKDTQNPLEIPKPSLPPFPNWHLYIKPDTLE